MGPAELQPEGVIRGDESAFLILRQDDECSIVGRYLVAEAEGQSLWQQVGPLDDLER
jgi:hypothetical protein